MGNIEEKTLALLLGRIDAIRKELDGLEDEIRAMDIPVEDIPVEAEAPVVEDAPVIAEVPIVEVEELPVVEEVPIAVDIPVEEDIPVVEDIPVAEDIPGPGEAQEAVDISIADDAPIDIDLVEDIPAPVPVMPGSDRASLAPAPELVEGPKKAILDTAKADTAVMDVMADKQAWRTDRPGMPVKNIISAISLNDRVFLINVLFGEDPMLFQETIAKFNSMGSLAEALDHIAANFPDWDMNSEPVYRLMMAVRRKLS